MSTEKPWDTSYEWKALLAMSVAFGLVGIDRFILPPLFPAMMKDLSLTYQDLGNLVAVLGIAWGVSAIATGFLSDRLGVERHGDRTGQSAAHPHRHGCVRRTRRGHRRRGGR